MLKKLLETPSFKNFLETSLLNINKQVRQKIKEGISVLTDLNIDEESFDCNMNILLIFIDLLPQIE